MTATRTDVHRQSIDTSPRRPSFASLPNADDGAETVERQAASLVIDQPTLFEALAAAADEFLAPLIGRGVYMTPWFYHGRRWLFVVDHTHSVIHLESVHDHGDREAQVQGLRGMLSALDPQPLELVAD